MLFLFLEGKCFKISWSESEENEKFISLKYKYWKKYYAKKQSISVKQHCKRNKQEMRKEFSGIHDLIHILSVASSTKTY